MKIECAEFKNPPNLTVCARTSSNVIVDRSLLVLRLILDVGADDAEDLKRFATFIKII
jgi:hypothetical protein